VADWAAVRIDYEASSLSVRAIREKHGVSAWKLRSRREKENWTRRPAVGASAGVSGGPRRPPAAGPDALALRLNRLVAYGLAMLERRVETEGCTEDAMRTLNELCRATRTLHGIGNKKAAKARETSDDEPARGDEPDQVLRELTERFDRLRAAAEGGGGRDPGGGER
jgi:hypothetical protein